MKKNLINEINEMKRLFAHQRGVVISEQNIPLNEDVDLDDVMFADTDTETEIERDVEKEHGHGPEKPTVRPDRGRDRDPGKLPYTDPDTHPQGRFNDDFDFDFDIDFAEPGVAEPEVKPDTDTDKKPFDPARRERRDRDPGRLPYEDPDTHPQGRFDDEVNEPFINDVDSEYENSDLADLVRKYLSNRG
jgi:hypothetical protein